MSCPKCGSALATGAGACPVCDPWATPSRPVTVLPARTAIPAQGKMPKWIGRAVRRNPPAYADLEKAWRNSVVIGSLMIVFGTFATAGVAAAYLVRSPGLAAVCDVVAALALLGVLGMALVVRKNFWLGRAIAVVGTRPDIGYERFARLTGISRLTRLLLALRVLPASCLLMAAFASKGSSLTTLDVTICVYMLLLVFGSTLQYVYQTSARRDLARLLSR